ncbi:hypothetical protein ACFL43_05940 [Thermodesulfobacteriota bacterium]
MVGQSTEDLTRMADTVVRGNVSEVACAWTVDKGSICTVADIQVEEVVRGTCPAEHITVEYAGGKVGERCLTVSDSPGLSRGEHVLVFLKSAKSQTGRKHGFVYHIVGQAQGVYRISSEGIASKHGYRLVASGKPAIDNNLKVSTLISKIKNIQ